MTYCMLDKKDTLNITNKNSQFEISVQIYKLKEYLVAR